MSGVELVGAVLAVMSLLLISRDVWSALAIAVTYTIQPPHAIDEGGRRG